MNWNDSVPNVSDGVSPANASTFNNIINVLANRTDWLKAAMDSMTNKSNTLARNVNLTADTVAGSIVYFDKTVNMYRPAKAVWSDVYSTEGELLAADSAYVEAMVVAKTTATTGDVLLDGLYNDAAVTANCLGNSPAPGLFYLSAVDAGKAVSTPPPLKVPVITYMGSNSFVFSRNQVLQPNHIHKTYTLSSADWLVVADSSFDDMAKPGMALWGYDIKNDAGLTELFAAYPGQLVAFKDGTLLDPTASFILFNSDNVWWSDATSPDTDITIFVYSPFNYGEPTVRDAITDTPAELEVTGTNGTLTINAKAWTYADVDPTGKALLGIVGKEMQRTTSISSIVAGPGANVNVNTSTGKATVSLDQMVEAVIDADIVNLNNTAEVTDDPFLYYVFPANREASIIGRCQVPKLDSGSSYKAAVWGFVKGIAGATVPTPITFPAVNIEATCVTSPRGVAYVDLSACATVSTSWSSFSSVQDYLYSKEVLAAGQIDVTSESSVFVKLSIPSGTYDKYLMRFGIIIYVV